MDQPPSSPLPTITVVTVTLNAASVVEQTLRSVLEQDYPHVEYIVIDGQSKDDTNTIVRRYEKRLSHWVIEPDRGIYDAMNKGIALATGDYINFMNAGDYFASPTVLSEVFGRLSHPLPNMVYGGHWVEYGYFRRQHHPPPLRLLWRKNVFVHQALFAQSDLMRQSPFDITLPYSADFDFFYSQYRQGASFYQTPTVICCFLAGGISERKMSAALQDRYQTIRKYDKGLLMKAYYQLWALRIRLTLGLKSILPLSYVRQLTRLKYRWQKPPVL